MANTALQKITTRAKQIRRKHPNKEWKMCIKQAAREIKQGKKVGATLLLEKGESRRTKPKKAVVISRTKKGLFKGSKTLAGITDKRSVAQDLQKEIAEQHNLLRQQRLLKLAIVYARKGQARPGEGAAAKKQLQYINRLIKANKKQVSILKALL